MGVYECTCWGLFKKVKTYTHFPIICTYNDNTYYIYIMHLVYKVLFFLILFYF